MDWADVDNPRKERWLWVTVLRRKITRPEVYFRLAEVYENVKDFNKAIYYGKRALKQKPNNTFYLEFMAFVCGKSGRLEAAKKYWELLLRTDLKDSHYWIEWDNLIDHKQN